MKIDPTIAFRHHFNPENPRVGIVTGMPMPEYQAAPGFSPHLVKRGANEIKDSGARGHVIRILFDVWAKELESRGQNVPVGYGRPERKADAFALGSVYHQLLLEPEGFDDHFAVITPALQESLVAMAKERKLADVPDFSYRLPEAQAFKKKHGRPATPEEEAEIMEQVRERKIGDVTFHPRMTEFLEWGEKQAEAGKTVLTVDQLEAARSMASAVFELPENREVAAYLEAQRPLGSDRCEVSMFTTMEWKNGGVAQLKGRPDLTGRDDAFLDPKSTMSVHPYDFAKAVDRFGYAIQAGGYTLMSDLLRDHPDAKDLGFPKKNFGFLAQESAPPYLAKLYWLPPSWIKYGRHRFLTILRQTYTAAEKNEWGGSGDEFQFTSEPDTDCPGEVLEPPEYLMATLEQFA